jgi:hypothetical protein
MNNPSRLEKKEQQIASWFSPCQYKKVEDAGGGAGLVVKRAETPRCPVTRMNLQPAVANGLEPSSFFQSS